MMRFTFFGTLIIFLALVPGGADAFSFVRDLRVGDSGEDVRALQQMLNANALTRIADFGPGSPGSETNFFGDKTAAAVVRYQNLHANKILAPLGLLSGTGYVGKATREMLMSDTVPTPVTAVSVTPQQVSAPVVSPKIFSITPTKGGVGTVVTITGEGFTPTGNKVASVFEEFTNLVSTDGKTLTIEIKGPFPEDFLNENKEFYKEKSFEMDYQLVVLNTNGVSGFMPFRFTFY